MDDSRYSRQELLIGKSAQKKLCGSHVAIIGIGALGTAASEVLARAGIGKITMIDDDVVKLTNLQRQLLFDESDIGTMKAKAAAEKLKKINSTIRVESYLVRVNKKNISKLVGKPDVILDCTDRMESRFIINEYCLNNKLPWIHGAALKHSGQIMVFNFRKKNQPCFSCAFGNSISTETADTSGILAATTVTTATAQATEAMKLLIGIENVKGLLRFDVLSHDTLIVSVRKRPHCISCRK
jgi:molybdopterin-synthase adenylyltransferase